jgi:flotillin
MTLADLQEKRADFVRAVQTTVASDLEHNGLELESASLIKLDQTDTQFFNPNNAFDAEGLATLTKIVEAKRRERNEVVRTTEVAIAQQDLDARKQTLTIDQQKREAELSQQRDITNKSAETRAAAAQREAEAKRAEEEARIDSDRAIAERKAEAQRLQQVASIAANLAIRQQQIAAEKEGETLAIAKQRDIELANQERAIAVADRSKAESEARALAEQARAKAISAEESVTTAREVAIAERQREIAIIEAKRDAEQKATELTVAAEAERAAAEDQAEAARTLARAEADAAVTRAEAQQKTYEVEAEGQRKLNEARNMLSPAIVEMEVTKERLRIIPLALAEAVKPLEKIGDVKIVDLGGALGRGNSGSGSVAGGGTSDNLLSMLLAYRAQAPMVDQLLKESGFTGADPMASLMNAAAGSPSDSGAVIHPGEQNAAVAGRSS